MPSPRHHPTAPRLCPVVAWEPVLFSEPCVSPHLRDSEGPAPTCVEKGLGGTSSQPGVGQELTLGSLICPPRLPIILGTQATLLSFHDPLPATWT